MEALGLIVFIDLLLTAFVISRFIIQCKTDQRIKRIEQKIDKLDFSLFAISHGYKLDR